MFNGLTKILAILTACVLALSAYQSHKIDRLQAENQTQAQTILEQEQANVNLRFQLEQEIEAVRNQQQIANELRQQMESKRESIKTILVKEPCSRTPMPRAVIKQLQGSR